MPRDRDIREIAKDAVKKSKMPTHKMPDGRIMWGKSHPKSKGRIGQRRGKRKSSDYGLGTDGLEGFKSAKQEIAERQKTKQRTRSKY